jgi:uncharacterized membrane protein
MPPEILMKTPGHIQEHIDTIAKQEQEFLANRSLANRLADKVASFAGGIFFVMCHLLVFAAWMLVNSFSFHIPHFDPMPYPLLDTIVALEAILLASFILMRQSGLARRADEREHLMLQILLLTEKEVSAVVRMNQQIADHIGLKSISRDKEIEQLGEPTSIDAVSQTIQEKLASE